MGWLVTTVDQTFDLVWLGDPAVSGPQPATEDPAAELADDGDAPGWVAAHLATLHAGQRPDVFTCRPLASHELLRLSSSFDTDPSIVIAAVSLGVKSITTGDGRTISQPEEVHRVLAVARNIDAVGTLCQAIVDVSREGLTAAPFLDDSAAVDDTDPVSAVRAAV